MSLINQAGTYRGFIISSGIGASSGGFDQFVANFEAAEKWNEDEQNWIDWRGYEESEIAGYFILFGKDDKPFRNCQQLMKALDWPGRDTDYLNDTDFSMVPVQFRVEPNTYNGKTSMRVEWIDHADATPGRTVAKLDAAGIKKVNARHVKGFKLLSGGPTISKPTTAPKPAPKATTKAKTGPKAGKPKATATAPTPPPPKTAAPEPDATSGEVITKEEAWERTCTGAPKSIPDEKVGEYWTNAIKMLGGEDSPDPESNLDPEDWARVAGIALGEMEAVG